MIHALITLAVIAISIPFHLIVYAAVGMTMYYFGREFAQAEYRIIEANYHRDRDIAPWYCGFMPAAWNLKGLTDFLLPATVGILAVIIDILIRSRF